MHEKVARGRRVGRWMLFRLRRGMDRSRFGIDLGGPAGEDSVTGGGPLRGLLAGEQGG